MRGLRKKKNTTESEGQTNARLTIYDELCVVQYIGTKEASQPEKLLRVYVV